MIGGNGLEHDGMPVAMSDSRAERPILRVQPASTAKPDAR